jgi:hypothetical protein
MAPQTRPDEDAPADEDEDADAATGDPFELLDTAWRLPPWRLPAVVEVPPAPLDVPWNVQSKATHPALHASIPAKAKPTVRVVIRTSFARP